MDTTEINNFQETVWKFYEKHGRSQLPWRETTDPYAILVSEVMLQQTQVDRVIPKYEAWLNTFPDFPTLAGAKLADVLTLWKGLGYNRRAKYLKKTAETVADEHEGTLPKEEEKLGELPGIGPYTAGAVRAFAWNMPVILIETNIRTVYLHHFFDESVEDIADNKIKELIGKTLPEDRAREWYSALMDYGTHLKGEIGNLNSRSKSYTKQSPFTGSNRQLRSKLLDFILNNQPVEKSQITKHITRDTDRQKSVAENLSDLEKEGMIQKNKNDVFLVSD